MNDDQLDNETVAAFLDGTLPEHERARVMRLLASSPDLLGDTLEAAKIAAELERESRPVQVLRPARPRWQRRALLATPLLAAAGIVGLLVVRRDDPPEVIALARSVELTTERGPGSIDGALGSAWDQPVWATVRGGSPDGRSVGLTARIGARVAQLELASTANDSVAYTRVASALAELVSSIDAAGPVAEQLRSPAQPSVAAHATLVNRLRALSTSPAAFDLGVWLETARLAGAAGSSQFLAIGSPALATLQGIHGALAAEGTAGAVDGVWQFLNRLLQPGNEAPAGARFALVDSALSSLPR